MKEQINWVDEDLIADDEAPVVRSPQTMPWRVLIVDDEPDIHLVTKLALSQVSFKGRPLEFLSAYSGAEGFKILATERDVALVLLDVVMESDDAGLKLAHRIREELKNTLVRIVLRTGQPGQAPEERVIVEYDINDYKSKTELSKQKLFTTVIASLRAYEGLVTIARHRDGLDKILHGTGNLYELRSLKEFASGVLNQVTALLDLGASGALCVVQEVGKQGALQPTVLAATGVCAELAKEPHLLSSHAWFPLIVQALEEKRSLFKGDRDALFIPATSGRKFVIAMSPPWPVSDLQRNLLEVFCDRISAAFDNLHMYEQLEKGQESTVIALADLAESRDRDTGGHVQRVARLTHGVAEQLQRAGKFPSETTPFFISHIGLASMLHDVGKVATPDAVLLKPGLLNAQERAVMDEHVLIGETVLLRAAERLDGESYLTYGAQIAGGHHEHFDGKGYPRALSGTDIPLSARIVAVVDVFDALLHRRPYKEPWPLPDVLAFVQARRGAQFDPDVVDALLAFIAEEQPDWLIGAH